ncbi:hypothetical protein [Domibacillus epiphyticus]|uniref:Uncharacterized protein n=1 Tax=Domibacillus epiphyticus TaxID=1714355 RepID=A0A1V2AAS2_9BACI|nr:hypothetical protein [Domibacillus epiphyticus]OMP68095.1 hypothetical protein BTO28_03850 [Domibacillus epiphyticus]
MIATLCSLDELKKAKNALDQLEQSYPALFEKMVHVINLTRALQLKYQFMGSLIMDEDPSDCLPNLTQGSVLRLYKKEVETLKNDPDSNVIKNTFAAFKDTGYAKLSLLALGRPAESLVGSSSVK